MMKNNDNLLDEALSIISNKGGRYILSTGKTNYARITTECDSKHIWETNIKAIRAGYWCKVCSQINNSKKGIVKNTKYSLLEIQKIAEDKGGKCLSDKYQKIMKFTCSQGHRWEARTNNINHNSS